MPDEPQETVLAPYGPLPEGGTVRPVVRWGTPVMHRPQQRVTSYDEDLRTLVADMVATMYAAEGVGLAACQIGVGELAPRRLAGPPYSWKPCDAVTQLLVHRVQDRDVGPPGRRRRGHGTYEEIRTLEWK